MTLRALDFPITDSGALSAALRAGGFKTFAAAAEHVRRIPYGRTDRPDDILAVLEHRGTCSSKHRLLAAVAHECGRSDIALTIGLYHISEHNTPGVGAVLAEAGVSAIPEAHCYLTYNGARYDFTGLAAGAESPFDSLIEERTVAPNELPAAKQRYHREAVAQWAAERRIDPDRAWELRERCIAQLSRTAPGDC